MMNNLKYVFDYIWNDKRLRYYLLASLLIVIFMVIFVTASDAAVVEAKETLPRDEKVEIPIVPSVLTHASAICREKYLPEGYNINNGNSKAEAQSLSKEITDNIDGCIRKQIESSMTIFKSYMKTINSWNPSPAKVVMQAIVASCFLSNVDRDGNINYTDWLECIRAKVVLLEQELDNVMKEMEENQRDKEKAK